MLPSNRSFLPVILLPALPALLILAACSEEFERELARDRAELMPVAQASKLGWQHQHSNPGSDAYVIPGDQATLTEQQLVAFLYLNWPQQQQSIRDRFGPPAYTSPERGHDYYSLLNGQTLTIHYQQGSAISYSIGDSGW